jgi:LPS O-antigen subunit length determinant protein (WzzB/FepE family)
MTTNTINTSPLKPDDEIDIIGLIKTIWDGRKTMFLAMLICGIIGLLIAVYSSKEFIATTIMVPSGNDATSKLGNLGGLGGLAAMAGINLNSTTGNDLSPVVYPQIVSSLPFQLELMNTPLDFKDLKLKTTFYEYYSVIKQPNPLLKYTFGLPGVILKALKGKEKEKVIYDETKKIIELTEEQIKVLFILDQLITLEVNLKEGFVTLSARMPEALPSAQLGQRAQELLQQYITEFKIKKAKSNLDFIQQRYDETTRKFEEAQQRLATFRDKNKNMSLAIAKTEEERLASQYNLIYSIYSELAKQLEQAKIQVKQDTPTFTIIEPISIPTKKSKPNRPLILLLGILLGGIIGVGIVFVKTKIEPVEN